MLLRRLFHLFVCFLISYSSLANEYYFNCLNSSSGLLGNAVMAICQDDVGAVWLGLYGGLNRYNGYTVENFPLSQDTTGLTQNVVYRILSGQNRKLYLRAGRDVLQFDLETEQFKTLIRDQAEDIFFHSSCLYVLTSKGVLTIDAFTHEVKPFMLLPAGEVSFTQIYVNYKGLWLGSEHNLTFYPLSELRTPHTILSGTNIQAIYEDRINNIWVGTKDDGAYRVAPDFTITHFKHHANQSSLAHNDVRDIVEDNYGNIYFGTFLGLNQYDPTRQKWHTYASTEGVNYSLSHSSVHSLYCDRQGSVWVGTWFGGVNRFNPSADIFKFYGAKSNDTHYLNYPFVGQMDEDDDGNLWIATEGGGLNFFDRATKRFRHYKHLENNPLTIVGNNVKTLHYDSRTQRLFIGTHASGLSVFNPNNQQFLNLKHNPDDPTSIHSNTINKIEPYGNDLILLTHAGLTLFDSQSLKCKPFLLNDSLCTLLRKPFAYESCLVDSAHNLWIARTAGGLLRVNLLTGSFREYKHDLNAPNSIGKFRIVSMLMTRHKSVLFGTVGSGLFEYRHLTDDFKSYTQASGDLLSDMCYAIGESSYEHIFVLHDKGMSLFNRDKSNINYSLRLPNTPFYQGSSIFFCRDGEIFIGSAEGLFRFYEPQLYTTYHEYNLYFDKLMVNNILVRPNDYSNILTKTLALSENIELTHKQNNFTISFAASNYIANTNYLFEYKLAGFDKEWIAAPPSGQIVYTNINPGRYRLIVRSTRSSDPVAHQIELPIRIRPPFYASVWGYLLYIIIIGYALYSWVRFNRSQAMLKASLEMERREKEQIEALNQMKLRFFTNISHEFRTPLSLIIAQIELLLSSDNLVSSVYNRVLKINSHANNLKRLITELLDFRKIDQGFIKLHVAEHDLVAFIHEIATAFYEYAQSRSIEFSVVAQQEVINVWFDPLQLSKVFNNLLTNAFKYTPQGGIITLTVVEINGQVTVQVSDSGKGIAPDALKHIFERFYQVDDMSVSGLSSSTGIGLALAKNIVDLHHGSIHVESTPDSGSTFFVTLSSSSSLFTDEERAQVRGTADHSIVAFLDELPQESFAPESIVQQETHESDRLSILIVEDNPSLLNTLGEIFSVDYKVYTAQDGEQGLAKARKFYPDLILSDVMMPLLSGKEMCHQIKQDLELSHIPVILLTANNSLEQAIEGYEFGADDYITKPFNVKMLQVRCSNLIRGRRQLMSNLSIPIPTVEGKKECTPENLFIEQVCSLIKMNFNAADFDINFLARELGMGRTKLYEKVKEITGITPNDLVLRIRMDQGAHLLLKEAHLTISEVSYQLGFSSPKYFTKSFKEFYSMSPLEYRKRNAVGQ